MPSACLSPAQNPSSTCRRRQETRWAPPRQFFLPGYRPGAAGAPGARSSRRNSRRRHSGPGSGSSPPALGCGGVMLGIERVEILLQPMVGGDRCPGPPAHFGRTRYAHPQDQAFTEPLICGGAGRYCKTFIFLGCNEVEPNRARIISCSNSCGPAIAPSCGTKEHVSRFDVGSPTGILARGA